MPTYALVTDRTATRATVAAMLDAEEAAAGSPSDETLEAQGLRRSGGGVAWHVVPVEGETQPGERIWLAAE